MQDRQEILRKKKNAFFSEKDCHLKIRPP